MPETARRLDAEQFRFIVDTMAVAVARCTRDLRYAWVNRVYAEWVGKAPEELIGRPIAEIPGDAAMDRIRPNIAQVLAGRRMDEVVSPQHYAAIRQQVERVLAGETVRFERLAELAQSGPRWISVEYTPTFEATGKADGWVMIGTDIHDRKLAEESMRESERRKDEFLALLAHELRNPLAPIRNAIAVLKKKSALDPEVVWSRELIDRQVDQLARLVDDLLDIERISRGRLLVRKERISLEQVIDLALETSRPHINAAGHHLSVVLPSERVMLDADPARLAQVFSNLLNNSAKYTEARGSISVHAALEGRSVAVRIEDSGIGFTAEAASRLFTPHAQLASAGERSHGGLGIGLTLVQGIVALHGGKVRAHSPGPGRGSQFTVRLPVSPGTGPDAAAPQRAGAGAPARSLRILVVDDNRDAADSLQRILELYGYQVRVAYDGAAAVQMGCAFKPRVAVLDIGMPGKNGYEVAREFRSQHGNGVMLVALTGWGQEGDRRRAMEAGFDYHLTKPVDPGVLNDLLVELSQ